MGLESNIPMEIEESVKEVLAKKGDIIFRRLVKLEVKAEKWENKVLALSQYRLFILAAKAPTKLEMNISFLDIHSLESKKPNQLNLVTEGKKVSLTAQEADTSDINHALEHLGLSLRKVFPTVPLERIITRIDILPAERNKAIMEKISDQVRLVGDPGPCGGFTPMYRAMCDYHNLPFMEDVAWDVDTIYLSQDTKELTLSDFDHMDSRNLIPIISALEHNPWFTKLNATNVKLSVDAANEILKVMKKNTTLEELWLSGIGAKWEFAHKLAMALLSNTNSPLTTLDLSHNLIEDRGLTHLCGPLSKLAKGLVSLNLAHTGITAKGVNRLAESLVSNRFVPTTLRTLDLSDNSLKGEELTGCRGPIKSARSGHRLENLNNFLAHPNSISTLCLSGTECALDSMFAALLRGCCQKLAHLDLSNNSFTARKTKDSTIPQAWKNFFASALSLETIKLSNCKLPNEAVKMLMHGLASNVSIKGVELDLSSNDLRTPGAQVIEGCIADIKNVHSLDLSDNGFDNDIPSLCRWIGQNQHLKKLSIGRNFSQIKLKHLPQVLDALVQMIQEEDSPICSLSIADSKLKTETTVVINALGSNSSLSEIDISGNQMGDLGARMLAKALQINTKLHTVYWDRNNTTAQGFTDIAAALEKNFCLKKMPAPIQDAIIALKNNQEGTEKALAKIEALLQRNHSPRKFASDQAYRLQQGFLLSSGQQMLDRLVMQLQDQTKELEKTGKATSARKAIQHANDLIKDAGNSRQLLLQLQQVSHKSEEEGNMVETRLVTMAAELQAAIEQQLQKNVRDMLTCADKLCPALLKEESIKREIEKGSAEKIILPPDFTRSLLLGQVGTDVMNKVGELNLAVSSQMSDRLIDGLLDSMDACNKTLIKSLASDVTDTSETVSPVTPVKETMTVLKDSELEVPSPISTLKRKSLHNRRLRPQSVIVPPLEDDGKGPPLSPIPASPLPASPAPSLSSSKSDDKLSLSSLDELPALEVSTGPRLEHLGKERPKRAKTRAPRRPAIQSEFILDNVEGTVDDGMESFYERREVTHSVKVVPEHRRKEEEMNKQNASSEKTKDEGSTKKKGWSPFGGNKPDPKGLAAGITSFFTKRDKSSPSSHSPETTKRSPPSHPIDSGMGRSPDTSRRQSSRTPERSGTPDSAYSLDEDKEEDSRSSKSEDELDETPPMRKQPLGVPKFGMAPVGGAALMAEMRTKRLSQHPTPTITKADNKENKDATPVARHPKESKFTPSEIRSIPTTLSAQQISSSPSTAATTSPAPSHTSVDSLSKPIPARRSISPAVDRPVTSIGEGSSNGPTPSRTKPPPPILKPKPPPVAPKPSKPAKPSPPIMRTTSATLPTTSTITSTPTSNRTSGYATTGRISESINEKLGPDSKTEKETEEAKVITRSARRLSVKEKVAALDKNSNEQPEPMSKSKSSTLPRESHSSKHGPDPQRSISMPGDRKSLEKKSEGSGDSNTKPSESKPTSTKPVGLSPGGSTSTADETDGTEDNDTQPNGSTPPVKKSDKDEEFVLFI